MTDREARTLARRITDYLFANGAGSKAKRLVLELPDGSDGGGWGIAAVYIAICGFLAPPQPAAKTKKGGTA